MTSGRQAKLASFTSSPSTNHIHSDVISECHVIHVSTLSIYEMSYIVVDFFFTRNLYHDEFHPLLSRY